MLHKTLVITAIVASGCGPTTAQTLKEVDLGLHLSGPKISQADLQDRVVVFFNWGPLANNSAAVIPQITKLRERYGPSVLQIVANQVQFDDTAPEWSIQIFSQNGGTDAITQIQNGKLKGDRARLIPRIYAFNHQGVLIHGGSGSKAAWDAIEAAIKASPGALAAGMQYLELEREARIIGHQHGNLTKTLAKLEEIAADKQSDPQAQKEAQYLLQRVSEWAKTGQEKIESLQKTNPIACMRELEMRADLLEGHALGEFYVERLKQLKKDKDYKNEVKAYQELRKLLAKCSQMGAFIKSDQPKYVAAKAAFRKASERFLKRNEGTIAARELADRLKRL